MKKLLIAVGLGLMTGSLYAACMGPYCYDGNTNGTMTGVIWANSGPIVASSMTILGLSARIGDLVICNSCTGKGSSSGYAVCVATSTNQPAFVTVSSTTQLCQ